MEHFYPRFCFVFFVCFLFVCLTIFFFWFSTRIIKTAFLTFSFRFFFLSSLLDVTTFTFTLIVVLVVF